MARRRRRNKNKNKNTDLVSLPEPSAYELDPSYFDHQWISGIPDSSHPGTYGLDYETLFAMSRLPVIGAIIQTRIQQIAEFATPQSSPYTSGFSVILADEREKMTTASRKRSREIQEMILSAGGKYGLGGFEPFVRAMMRDSLTYDQANFEVLFDRAGRPLTFVAVDASTIRRAKPKDTDKHRGRRTRYNDRVTAHVQRVRGKVVADFTQEEMAWGVRRPRTTLWTNGYGYPELEELMKVVTDLANAQNYNSVNFTNGVHSSTILALKSTMTAEVFRSFKRQIVAMMSGVHNARRTPIVQLDPDRKEEIQAINLSNSNRDMEYMQFVGWLTKLTAAVYSMDPAEIGLVYGTENQTATLSTGGPQQRIIASKERGLRPILRSLESWLNHYFVQKLDPNFRLQFVGLDSVSEQEKLEMDIKAIKHYKTINEIREEHDLKKIDNPLADMILDPTYMNSGFSQLQMEEAGEDEGGGEDGEDWYSEGGSEFDLGKATERLVENTENAISGGVVEPLGRMQKGRKKLLRMSGKKSFIVEV
jgi:hypothetical protein